jgi:uroporphyrinogen decarboxylase
MMIRRDIVMDAINHKEPERLPRDLGSKGSTIALGAYSDLLKHMSLSKDIVVLDQRLGLAQIDEDVLEKFNIDTRYVYAKSGSKWDPKPNHEEDTFIDEWGGQLKRPKDGYYYDHIRPTFSEANLSDLNSFDWPDPSDPARFSGLREVAKEYYERGFAIGSYMKGCSETIWIMRGMENAFKDMIMNKKYYQAIAEKVSDILSEIVRNFLEATKPYVQFFCLTCDLGTQLNPLVSPKFVKDFILPYESKIYEAVRGAGAKVAHHSCGAIFNLIPLLIDQGVEILNPVQLTANGMDAEKLKKAYGDKICFWGGLDTQQLVPKGTPEEVRDEARRLIDVLHKDGGYLFAPCHDIQMFTPPENILAIFEAADQYENSR